MRRSTGLRIIAAALLGGVAPAGLAAAQEVGRASAVNPAATANMRTITIGSSIAHKERIQTQAGGSVQLLFLDKTSMTIGPNSDLTIDEYVYNPNAGTGKLAATLGKGALRFVGGQISHTGDAEIKTASAVIGIRGGVALIGPDHVYAGYGSSTVTSGGSTVTLGAGEFTQTQGGGAPPTPPGPPPTGFVASQIRVFQSSGGQTGGAGGSATPAAVSRAETRATGSPTGTVAQVAPVGPNGVVQVVTATNAPGTGGVTNQQNSIVNTVTQSTQTSSQTTAATVVAEQILDQPTTPVVTPPVVTPPVVTPPPPPQTFAASAFALTSTRCCDSASPTSPAPFLPAAFATGSNTAVAPLLGYRPASTGTVAPASFFQYGINISGQGANQSSWFETATGTVSSDGAGGLKTAGGFTGARRGVGTNEQVGFASGAFTGSAAADAKGLPTTGSVANSGTTSYFLSSGAPVQTYGYNQALSRTASPEGLGSNRPAATLTAFTGGTSFVHDITTGAPQFGTVFRGTGVVVLNPVSNGIQASFALAGVGAQTNATIANMSFGALETNQASRSAYVDYNNFAARDAVFVDPQTGATSPTSTINGQSLVYNNSELVTVTPEVARQLAPALSSSPLAFCQCDLTRWGFWSSQAGQKDPSGDTLESRSNLVPWVAGQSPTAVEIPTTGTATYGGHVVANVVSNANVQTWNQYVAAGNLMVAVNFGSRTGAAAVTGFDNTNYGGAVSINASDPRRLTANLSSQDRNRTMALDGQFFRSASSPSGEMGGSAVIASSDSSYLASGIFAASTTGVAPARSYAAQAFAMTMSNCCGNGNASSAAPYLPAGFFNSGAGAFVTPVLGYRNASVFEPASAVTLQYGLNITGTGAAQSSSFFVATGAFLADGSGGLVNSSGFFASRRDSAGVSMGRANGTFSSTAGSVTVDANRLPVTANISNDYYVAESRNYVANPAFAFPGGGGQPANYTFNQTATSVATPTGLGASRPDVSLTGYTGGLMRTFNTDTSSAVAPTFGTVGTATVVLDSSTSRVQANFTVANASGSSGDSLSFGSFQLGSTSTSLRSESAYIDSNNFGARRQLTVTNAQTGETAPVSTVNGQALTNHNAAMVNISPATAQQYAASTGTAVNFCQCEYTKWGFWSTDSDRKSAGGANLADRGNLMTWVAGRETTIAEVPTTGVATYDGHVIASIKNGNNEYVAAGNLTNVVDFGARNGRVTSSLDGTSYAGALIISPSDPRNIGASLSSIAGAPRTLTLAGQFFRGVASPVGEMGGLASVSGSNYIGSGIFAAKMR